MSQYSADRFRSACGALAPLRLKVSGPGWTDREPRIFEQPFVLVGRHERSGLRLEDEAVSRRHAYLQQLGGRVFCLDLGSRTGIRWGQHSRPAGWLRPEEGIHMGPFTLELAADARTTIDPGAEIAESSDPLQDRVNDSHPLPCIAVEVGHKTLSQMRVNRALVLVGSSPACRIRLRDDAISKYHCSLVRTPEGVWIIDLLSGIGTRLNGQPISWTLLKDGDRLRIGPYALRVWYEDSVQKTPALEPAEISAAVLMPAEAPALPTADQTAAGDASLVRTLQAELDQLRERLGEAEALKNQLDDSQSECTRLREQVRALESQVAEMTALQTRLEAAEANKQELEIVRAERDRWQTEAQDSQSRSVADSVERKELRQQLDEAQQQLSEERETVRSLEARLEQMSASLEEVQSDLATRNAELAETSQRLQQTEEQFARAQEEARGLQVDLGQYRERQQDHEDVRQQLMDAQAKYDDLSARIPELEERANSAELLSTRLDDADTEKEQLRVQLRTAETRLAELEDLRPENARLSEQVRTLETQVAEMDALQSRLEAAETNASELEIVRAERERWQTEAQELQTRITSASADREEMRQQFEELQQEYDKLRARIPELENQANSAEPLRARLGDAETELERLQVQLRTTETRLAEMENVQAEAVRLREQVHALESPVAEMTALRASLEAAEGNTRELEIVRAERDRWQSEMQELQNRVASKSPTSEQLDRLTADLQAVQVERDRLLAEQQSSSQLKEQASARISDLERALADATATHEKALAESRAQWESERQTLQARLEQTRPTDDHAIQAAIRDVQIRAEAAIREVQTRAAAEREEWRQRLEGAEAQIVWERGMLQEQSGQLRQQVAMLQAERDRLAARLSQPDSSRGVAVERSRDEVSRAAQPDPLQQLSARDQVFAEIRSIQVGHPMGNPARPQSQEKPTEKSRARVNLEGGWSQVGTQGHTIAIEQGIEAAWTQAAAGRERQAAIHTPPNRVEKNPAEVASEAGANRGLDNPSPSGSVSPSPSDTDAPSPPSPTQQESPTSLLGEQPQQALLGSSSGHEDEESQGLLRKFFNFVRGK